MVEKTSGNSETREASYEYVEPKNVQLLLEQEWKKISGPSGERGHGREGLAGLALSGGGIRSAIFSLGGLQALARAGWLEKIDYLSTASGGGYIGSSLSWLLHKKWTIGERTVQFGTKRKDFPYGSGRVASTQNESDDRHTSLLGFLRARRNYLFPGGGIGIGSAFSIVLRGIVLNLSVYVATLSLLFLVWREVETAGTGWVKEWCGLDGTMPMGLSENGALWVATITFVLWLSMVFIYALGTLLLPRLSSKEQYSIRRRYEVVTGWMWTYLIVLPAAVGSIEVVYFFLQEPGWRSALSGILTAIGSLSGLLAHSRSSNESETGPFKLPLDFVVRAGSIMMAYGIALGAFAIATHVLGDGRLDLLGVAVQWWYLLIFALVIGWIANVNYISLHRYYRDRLMESFMPDVAKAANDDMGAALEADRTPLHQMCDYEAGATGPYHIVNANVVLVDSKKTRYRGRGGDSFILSPLYCGSGATGWQRTQDFIGGKMTLSSAMAISGAAANPNTGAGGEGPTRGRALSFLMSILNIRLGYWAKTAKRGNFLSAVMPDRPNFFVPGLWEVVGMNLSENKDYLMLTDAGHFDNLAIFELVRRRTKIIFVFDGSADPDYNFGDFGSVAERIRADFGATIDIDLSKLVPSEQAPYPSNARLAHDAFAVGKITYSGEMEPREGFIIYIKSTLVDDLPNDILSYKATNVAFPHQSTADQVFDERQFEAYRELGYQLVKSMIVRARTVDDAADPKEDKDFRLRKAMDSLLGAP